LGNVLHLEIMVIVCHEAPQSSENGVAESIARSVSTLVHARLEYYYVQDTISQITLPEFMRIILSRVRSE